MTSRSALLACGICLVVGLVVGSLLAPDPVPVPGGEGARTGRPEAAGGAGLTAELTRLRVENEALQAANADLRRALDAAGERARLAEAVGPGSQPEKAPEAVLPPSGGPPRISFGAWSDAPALRSADWTDMGIRARDLVVTLGSGIGGRQPTGMAALEKKAIRELGAHLDRIEDQQPERISSMDW